MAQTTVTNFATRGFVGRLSRQRASDVLKAGPLLAAQVIPFGTGLVLDPDATNAVKLPSLATQKLAGVSYDAATLQMQLANGALVPAFGQGDIVTYAARASEYVAPEQDILPGDDVYCRFTAGAGELKPGRFRKSDGATNPVFNLSYAGVASTMAVQVGANVVSEPTGDPDAFAGLIAAQPGVVSVSTDRGTGEINVETLPGVVLSNASVTGSGASVALTNPTPAVAAIAFAVPNARWIGTGTGNPDLLEGIDAVEIEFNTP